MLAFIVFLNVSFVDAHFIWVWFGLTAAWIRNGTNDMGRVPCYFDQKVKWRNENKAVPLM